MTALHTVYYFSGLPLIHFSSTTYRPHHITSHHIHSATATATTTANALYTPLYTAYTHTAYLGHPPYTFAPSTSSTSSTPSSAPSSTSTMIRHLPASCWVSFIPSLSLLFRHSKFTHSVPLPKITSSMTVTADKSLDLTIRDASPRRDGRGGHGGHGDAAVGSIYVIEALGVNNPSLSLFSLQLQSWIPLTLPL